ncbi:MAG TPA: COG1361 S-layer family protein [Candidatus Nanoarchaeia archaeon]|nr:COG1361 S-layer family protein [Candidatus Nanoarchaeia archaeon]
MKKANYLAVILVIMLAAIGMQAHALVNAVYYGKSPSISVTLASQDPDPVEPGKIVEMNFKIENQGSLANNVKLEVLPEYPFTLLPGEVAEKDLGSLGATQDNYGNVFVKYRFKVDQDAVDANHEIKLRYNIDNSQTWSTIDNLFVKVQSKEAILSVDKTSLAPETVAPGSKARLTIMLKNNAASVLKDVKVTLGLGKSGDEETPFAPVGSTNEKVISVINAKSSESVEFNLVVDPDAKSKVYKVPVTLEYSDILNEEHSKELTLSVLVGVTPDVSVYIDGTTIYSADNTGEVTIKIVNKGLNDIKFANVMLEPSDGYQILSPGEVYIGNVDSDDYETADFKLNVKKTSDKKIVLPLNVQYKDSNNQDYTKKLSLELPLYTKSEAKKLGLVEGSGSGLWIVVVILIVVGFFGYRMWKKRKK